MVTLTFRGKMSNIVQNTMRTRTAQLLSLLVALSLSARAQQDIYVEPLHSVGAFATSIRAGASNEREGLIAVASIEKSVKLYDAKTLAEQATLAGLESPVSALLISKDGKTLVSAKANGQITWWNLSTKSKLKDLAPHPAGVIALAELQQGFILTVGVDRSLKILDPASERVLATSSRQQDEVTTLAVHPSVKIAITGTSAGWVRMFSLPELGEVNSFDTKGRITAMAVSADGKALAIGGFDGSVRVWNVETMTHLATFVEQRGAITALAFDPKSRWLVSASTDSSVQICDPANGKPLKSIAESDGYVSVLSFAGEDILWAGTSKGVLKTWRVLEAPPDTDPPAIVITNPPATPTEFARALGSSYEIRGKVKDKSNLKGVSIDGALTALEVSDASDRDSVQGMRTKLFSGTVKLDSIGMNTFEVRALDEFGNIAKETVRIQRLSNDQAIEVASPLNNFETEKTSVQLQFSSWCDVAAYQVIVNLAEMVDRRDVRGKSGREVFSEEIPLVVGYNQIQLTVTSRTGEKFTKTLGVSRKVFGAVSAGPGGKLTPKDRGPGPQRWAVVVGISEYAHKGIPALKFADRDAQAFAEFLQKPEGGGFEPDHMRILLNKDATLANLKEALIDFLSNAIDKDLVMIFFAGHGAPDPARLANLYLLTHDADPARLGTTAFPMWDIQTVLTRHITAKKIVVFSDACHSGGISADFAARGMNVTESNLINQYLADLVRTKDGIVVFTASAAGEVSQEFPELGHGVFTHYVLEGMKGEADFNNDYTVTINELMQYVEEQVKRKTKGAQNPMRSQTTYDKDLTISLIAH